MFKFVILVYFYFIYLSNVFGFSRLIVNNMIVNETKDELSRKPNEIYFVPKNSTTDSHSILITKLNFTKQLESSPHDLFVIGENPNYFKYHITSNNGVKPKIPPKNPNEEEYKKKLEYFNLLFNCSVLANTLKHKSVTKSKMVPTTSIPVVKKITDWKKPSKRPIKIKYESPAPVKFLENTLNTMYSFFEDTFTTKVKVPNKKSKRQIKLKKVLRNKKINRRQGLSSTPAKKLHTTPSVKINKKITPKNNKQFMTTQIHVTSEYGGPTTPAFVEHPIKAIVIKKNDQSESSEDDDYDFDFSFDNEEDSSESSSEEKTTSNYKNDEYDDDDEVDDDYDDNDDNDDDSDSNSIFGRVFASITKLFSGNRKKKSSNYYQYDEGRSTTPRIDYRNSKYSSNSENSENSLQKTWYNPYIPSSLYELSAEEDIDEINEITTNVPTTQNGWFNNWFQEEDISNKIDEIITTTSRTTKDPGWFNGLFGNPFDYEDEVLSTTTAKPLIKITDTYTNPIEWISFLKQKLKLKSKKTKNSDVSVPKRKYYNKYQMWRIYPTTIEHVSLLEDFRFSSEENDIQWWKGPTLRYKLKNINSPSF